MFIRLFRTSFREQLRCLPAILGCLALFGAILASLLLLAFRILHSDDTLSRATVALVKSEREDPTLDLALRYISSLSSTSLALDYESMSQSDALAALDRGDVIAVALIPDGLIDGIMNGQNPPVRIIFSQKGSLGSVLLSELAAAGCRMLSSAQAASYTAAELYHSTGMTNKLADAYEAIDVMNISQVLNREKLFDYENAQPGMLSYLAAAGAMLIFFSHIAYAPALRRKDSSLRLKLHAQGAGSFSCMLAPWLCNTLFSFALLLLLYLFAAIGGRSFDDILISIAFSHIFFLFCSASMLAAFSLFLWQLIPSAAAVLLQLMLSLCALLLGGMLIPSAFLPGRLLSLGQSLPQNLFAAGLMKILDGSLYVPILPILLWACGFLGAAVGLYRYREGAAQ